MVKTAQEHLADYKRIKEQHRKMAAKPNPHKAYVTKIIDRKPDSLTTIRNHFLSDAFGDIDKLIRKARVILAGVDYDTMVGAGMSGSVAVPTLARELGKYWAIARRNYTLVGGDDSDPTLKRLPVEGTIGRRWIFVDDMVIGGSCRDEALSTVVQHAEQYGHETTYVGTYLYWEYHTEFPLFTPAGTLEPWFM